MKYQVNITQELIDKGVRGASYDCPISLGLKKAVGCLFDVTWRKAYPKPEPLLHLQRGASEAIMFERKVTQFMKNFDSGRSVEPFTFEIDYEKQSNDTQKETKEN